MKNDRKLGNIFTSNYHLYLSQYAYEVLVSIMERNQLKAMDYLFFDNRKRKIYISKNLTNSAYIGKMSLGTNMSPSELEKVNSQPYYHGLNREDYIFMAKLEDLYIRKITKDQRDTKKEKEALAKQLREKKEVDIDENLLGKRGLSLDQKKVQVEKNTNSFMFNGAETRLRYRIEYSKDYLDRAPIDDRKVEPDVMKINVNDVNDSITCVETNLMMRVLLIGCASGKIEVFYLSEDGKDSDPLLDPQPDKENLDKFLESKAEDFYENIKVGKLVGHSSAITGMSINYDSSYFVSSSVDSTIRYFFYKAKIV